MTGWKIAVDPAVKAKLDALWAKLVLQHEAALEHGSQQDSDKAQADLDALERFVGALNALDGSRPETLRSLHHLHDLDDDQAEYEFSLAGWKAYFFVSRASKTCKAMHLKKLTAAEAFRDRLPRISRKRL